MQFDAGGVEHAVDQRVHVVGALGAFGQQRLEVDVDDLGVTDLALVAEEVGQGAGALEGVFFALGDDVHHATAPAVHLGAAETLHVDVLTRDAAHNVGTGDEDATRRTHDHDVGECRAVRSPTRGRSEHDRDLRHLARRESHRGEHPADPVEALDAFAQSSTA